MEKYFMTQVFWLKTGLESTTLSVYSHQKDPKKMKNT